MFKSSQPNPLFQKASQNQEFFSIFLCKTGFQIFFHSRLKILCCRWKLQNYEFQSSAHAKKFESSGFFFFFPITQEKL